ncbi:MAG: DUF4381 domain-containing protein [Paracoccus sp. (in: a-proteobacteria)]
MEPDTAPDAGDTLIDLIGQLVEPTPPPPVPMVPQTWGWAVLAVLMLAALGWAIWRWIRHRRANAYRRAALRLLESAGDDPARIAEILRRTALAAYPRGTVASLNGAGWLAFLDAQVGGDAFSAGPGRGIATAPYRIGEPNPQLRPLAANWIRRHRRGVA